jgi:hypothetical protein
MGSYRVTDPITGKVLILHGNSPPTEEELNQIFTEGEPITAASRAMIAEGSKPKGKELWADRMLKAEQGMTLGWGDELVGAIGGVDRLLHGGKFGEGYNSTVEKARRDEGAYEQARPLEALGVEAAGMIPGLVVGSSLAGARGASPKALSLGTRVLNAAKAGSLFGAVSGAGNANGDLLQRAKGAGLGALAGGTLGAAIPVAPATLRGVKRLVTRTVQSPEEFAAQALSRAFDNDNISLPTAEQTVSSGNKTLLDVGGRATTALAEQGALEGKGRQIAENFFDTVDKNREGQVLDRVKNIVSDQPLYDKMDELATKRATDARPLYLEAYAQPYRRTPKLVDLSKRPAVGGAMRSAMTRLKNDPDIDPAEVDAAMSPLLGSEWEGLSDAQIAQRLTSAMGTRPVEFKVLDYIKRGLDNLAEDPSASKEVRKLRRAWREELKTINPKYGKALNAWSGPSAVMDSMTQGREFDRMDPEAIQRALSDMGESEQESFRVGVSRRLQDLASGAQGRQPGQTSSMSLATAISGNKVMQRRLEAALGGAGADADTMLGRNGWKPVGGGRYQNANQPGASISVDANGQWRLEQASKSGKSSSLKNAGADQSSLESFITGQPAPPKPKNLQDLLDMADEMVDRNKKKAIVIGNSATARRLEGAENFDAAGNAIDQVAQAAKAARHGLVGMAGHAFTVGSDYLLKGLTSSRREQISKLLHSIDRDDNLRALDIIKNLRNGKSVPEVLYQPGFKVPAATGQLTGKSTGD